MEERILEIVKYLVCVLICGGTFYLIVIFFEGPSSIMEWESKKKAALFAMSVVFAFYLKAFIDEEI